MSEKEFIFFQIHIDAARNSTDDFNPFHDKTKWQRINQNPFNGPIVLGFQLECLIEHQIRRYRQEHGEIAIITDNDLRFSNYQFTFANVVRPKEPVSIDIKKSRYKNEENCTLSNRVIIKTDEGVCLIGHKKESRMPLCLPDANFSHLGDLHHTPDRSYLTDSTLFLKRKYMNTGNAKNFLSGSLVEQSDYFDELENKACFPEMFPCGLISCALLERALKERHDFETAPMVYTSHHISIDRKLSYNLKSNDVLHILVSQPEITTDGKGLGKFTRSQHVYQCFGLTNNNSLLYRAEISLTPLAEILKSFTNRQTG